MAAPSHVFTIARVARRLGEDEAWLEEIALELEPEDGRLYVCDLHDEVVVTAFTSFGVERLKGARRGVRTTSSSSPSRVATPRHSPEAYDRIGQILINPVPRRCCNAVSTRALLFQRARATFVARRSALASAELMKAALLLRSPSMIGRCWPFAPYPECGPARFRSGLGQGYGQAILHEFTSLSQRYQVATTPSLPTSKRSRRARPSELPKESI